MDFEGDGGWYYLMTKEVEMFKVEVPYCVAHEIWNQRNPDDPMCESDLRDWMASSALNFFPRIGNRVSPKAHPRKNDDARIRVTPIAKETALYKAALCDRLHPEFVGGPHDRPFVPLVNNMFAYRETPEECEEREEREERELAAPIAPGPTLQ